MLEGRPPHGARALPKDDCESKSEAGEDVLVEVRHVRELVRQPLGDSSLEGDHCEESRDGDAAAIGKLFFRNFEGGAKYAGEKEEWADDRDDPIQPGWSTRVAQWSRIRSAGAARACKTPSEGNSEPRRETRTCPFRYKRAAQSHLLPLAPTTLRGLPPAPTPWRGSSRDFAHQTGSGADPGLTQTCRGRTSGSRPPA
eukprot:scaffold104961_cov23-Tisochrysis_lutea.AAC.2